MNSVLQWRPAMIREKISDYFVVKSNLHRDFLVYFIFLN